MSKQQAQTIDHVAENRRQEQKNENADARLDDIDIPVNADADEILAYSEQILNRYKN